MKKTFIFTTLLVAFVLCTNLTVKGYSTNQFVKTDITVTDASLNAFGTYYDAYVPAPLKKAYESDGGLFYVIPSNYVRSDVDLSGWSGGNLSNVTGFLDANGAVPVIYLNSKVVDNANRYRAGTDTKVILHELGHYVNLKANQLREGSYSYDVTKEMEAAYLSESGNIKYDTALPDVLHNSFLRNTSCSEYYANIFAGLLIDPVNTQALFPLSSMAVQQDYATICAAYPY